MSGKGPKAILKYANGEKIAIEYHSWSPCAYINWKGEDLNVKEGHTPGNFHFVWWGKSEGGEEALMYKQLTIEDCKDVTA